MSTATPSRRRDVRSVGGPPGKRPPSGARAEAKRAAILTAARRCFVADGFDANLDHVAEMADVSKMTIYNHFGSKEALFTAVIDDALSEALDEAVTMVETTLSETSDLRSDLIAACRAWVAGIGSPEMLQLRNLVVGEFRRFPQLVAEWSEKGPQRFHPVIASALRRLVRSDRLTVPDVELAVLQLSGLVVSPTLVYGAYGQPPSPRRTDKLIVGGVDMFLDHYAYRGT